MAMTDKEFLDMMVKAIVAHPEDVRSERTIDERGVLITLNINPEDMGYVIGRQGQTAKAIRTLLKIVGAKNNARVNLKIAEPEGSTHVRRPMRDEREEVSTDAIDDLKI
ncbi:RNA-binding protein [Candidatus Falkowbacteria bacterium CG10_big_fil_rev_8_21_14_0_10_43_11]|uniref:RNA-binding protein KhpA n=1 Tax=Candidatus Falkowbacteria bacterium CG10_big_fil_rev_8_21_14_0_10_43_11 TaxID=1974568 RepID=A0A2M6WN13_9BACT|nr:MAG: RNA-binding protein [Candidatus Falkowbacteria bacterium CG10_big_fil_rev_8_21_14_0_10_43_11]